MHPRWQVCSTCTISCFLSSGEGKSWESAPWLQMGDCWCVSIPHHEATTPWNGITPYWLILEPSGSLAFPEPNSHKYLSSFFQKGSGNGKDQDSCAICTLHKTVDPGEGAGWYPAHVSLAKPWALALASVHVKEEVYFLLHKGIVCLPSNMSIGLRMSRGGTYEEVHIKVTCRPVEALDDYPKVCGVCAWVCVLRQEGRAATKATTCGSDYFLPSWSQRGQLPSLCPCFAVSLTCSIGHQRISSP